MRSNYQAQTVGESDDRPTTSYSGGGGGGGSGAPLGIKLIVALGLIGSFLGGLGGLLMFTLGAEGFILGLFVIGFSFAQAYVLLGLVSMESWAYPWAMGLYGLSVLINLVTAHIIGVIIAVIILGYLATKSHLY